MNKNLIIKWLRIIHRDLGFLMVGISVIYAVSGILLNHMGETDPAFKTIEESITIQKGLTSESLEQEFEAHSLPAIKRVMTIDTEHLQVLLDGGVGVYNSATGELDYERHTRRDLVYWINRLHYSNVQGWSLIADLFAGALIFFAISGLFLVKGKKGIRGRGKWYLLIGLLIPILFVLLQ